VVRIVIREKNLGIHGEEGFPIECKVLFSQRKWRIHKEEIGKKGQLGQKKNRTKPVGIGRVLCMGGAGGATNKWRSIIEKEAKERIRGARNKGGPGEEEEKGRNLRP